VEPRTRAPNPCLQSAPGCRSHSASERGRRRQLWPEIPPQSHSFPHQSPTGTPCANAAWGWIGEVSGWPDGAASASRRREYISSPKTRSGVRRPRVSSGDGDLPARQARPRLVVPGPEDRRDLRRVGREPRLTNRREVPFARPTSGAQFALTGTGALGHGYAGRLDPHADSAEVVLDGAVDSFLHQLAGHPNRWLRWASFSTDVARS
jgi:hypothetical protein